MRAVVAGSATPMGWPGCGGPGQLPAVSSACAVTPPSTAAWISGIWCPGGAAAAPADQTSGHWPG